MHRLSAEAYAATTSVATASTLWLVELELYFKIGASAVAIVAGLLAIYAHFKKR
jgi:hypothetical protein